MNEVETFFDQIKASHNRVDPCFMTGKGCVYSQHIKEAFDERAKDPELSRHGFIIRPFRQNIEVYFKNCLQQYIDGIYGKKEPPNTDSALKLDTSDKTRKPGIIICEGICKRIQESDFVIADISLPNGNVFYELGLAFGLNQKIIVVRYDHFENEQFNQFGENISKELHKLECRVYNYRNLDPIKASDFHLSEYLWKNKSERASQTFDEPQFLFYERLFDSEYWNKFDNENKNPEEKEGSASDDIEFSFETHVLSAIGLAVNKIYEDLGNDKAYKLKVITNYRDLIEKLKVPKTIKADLSITDIQSLIDSSYGIIIRTGEKCHPMSYFWLGYCHALGKNVIPISIIDKPNDPIKDLAFDIRAQRHMTYSIKQPILLEEEMHDSLKLMIHSDFSEWSRKKFWNEIIGSGGEVSIFTGALHNKEFDREMIGDWDLRTVSELTSYFGQHHHRFKIETPIWPPDRAIDQPLKQESRQKYIAELLNLMVNKNCIIIASPDVNPLTEIVLGLIYGVPPKLLFNEPLEIDSDYYDAMIAFKQKHDSEINNPTINQIQRAFYKEVPISDKAEPMRGFECATITGHKVEAIFQSQTGEVKPFAVHAHLVVANNPFVTKEKNQTNKKYIILLNGVSGPATYALSQVLTGAKSTEFAEYEDNFVPEATSEKILKNIIQKIKPEEEGIVECIIEIKVGALDDKKPIRTFDGRIINKWDSRTDVFKDEIRVNSFTLEPQWQKIKSKMQGIIPISS